MENFIGVYENAFSKEYCEAAIAYFDKSKESGFTKNRQKVENISATLKNDEALFAHDVEEINVNYTILIPKFNDVFWKIYKEQYALKFSVLNEAGSHNNYAFKIQKTEIGGGYHTWHFESDSRGNCHRVLAWTLYLNDVEEGGETEFLYQHLRVKPKAGTLIIWPAAFTHTHRGNPPLSNTKYIITGWTEF